MFKMILFTLYLGLLVSQVYSQDISPVEDYRFGDDDKDYQAKGLIQLANGDLVIAIKKKCR